MSPMTSTFDTQDVAAYLASHPGFFDAHADLLASLTLASPVSGRVISLQERQLEVLRTQIRAQERRLEQMLCHARDNSVLADKLLEWIHILLPLPTNATLVRELLEVLRTVFILPHASLRLWEVAPAYTDAWFAAPVDSDIQNFAQGLQQPYCGPNQHLGAAAWLRPVPPAESVALLPLRRQPDMPAFGLLVLGASDGERFQPGMGTDFLARIAATASVALAPLLE